MVKKYSDKNVYEAAQERIAYIFNEFENILISFSGGKDSGVLLNLCYDYAKKNNMLHKLAVYHLDYEAQYDLTTQYVDRTFKQFADIRRFWLCLPIQAQCACNMSGGFWIPWAESDRDIWCRPLPEYDYVMNINNCPAELKTLEIDYELQDKFCAWFQKQYGRTGVMIGIRTDESLNRLAAITSGKKVNNYKGKHYIVENKCYPIYDWNVEDIWVANYKFQWDYNKLYDLFYQAGMTLDQMRVASPFNDCATTTLKFYKVIEPHTWGKLVSRVNGVNFAGIYGGTTAMGWKSITKPKGHTWKSYCEFLLSTLDEKTRNHYQAKLDTSIKFWKEKGGALSDETVSELQETTQNIQNRGKISKISEKDVITFGEYPDDIPEVTNFKEVPSYKRMCVCILKNDYFCRYMGFAPTREDERRKKETLEKYQSL